MKADGKTPRRGGGSAPAARKLRVQYHLGESLVERLGVHCALAHRSQSAVVEEVVAAYLARFGRGRELFAIPPVDDLGPQDISAG